MKLIQIASLMLLALPLAACASNEEAPAVTHAETANATEASLPEVRYYMIADT